MRHLKSLWGLGSVSKAAKYKGVWKRAKRRDVREGILPIKWGTRGLGLTIRWVGIEANDSGRLFWSVGVFLVRPRAVDWSDLVMAGNHISLAGILNPNFSGKPNRLQTQLQSLLTTYIFNFMQPLNMPSEKRAKSPNKLFWSKTSYSRLERRVREDIFKKKSGSLIWGA